MATALFLRSFCFGCIIIQGRILRQLVQIQRIGMYSVTRSLGDIPCSRDIGLPVVLLLLLLLFR
jgi:hypothetical protein